MKPAKPEPVQIIKQRRDNALKQLIGNVPYFNFLGISFDRRGNELTGILSYDEKLIGNPFLPALHGGVTGAFLEATMQAELAWSIIWSMMEAGGPAADSIEKGEFPPFPKTIDITVDYLRSGLPRDAYARARIVRQGRRYASVQVEAWQDNREKPIAAATGHFLMPQIEK